MGLERVLVAFENHPPFMMSPEVLKIVEENVRVLEKQPALAIKEEHKDKRIDYEMRVIVVSSYRFTKLVTDPLQVTYTVFDEGTIDGKKPSKGYLGWQKYSEVEIQALKAS